MGTGFYREMLGAAERALMDGAPVKAALEEEIAFVRARVATLAAATSEGRSAAGDVTQLVRMLEVLTRMVQVQSRVGAADVSLAELNDGVRRRLEGEEERG